MQAGMKHSGNISTVSMRHQIQPSQLCGTWAAHSGFLKTSLFSFILAPCRLCLLSFSLYLLKALGSSSYRPPFRSLCGCWGDQCISEPCSEQRAWETFVFRAGSTPSLATPGWNSHPGFQTNTRQTSSNATAGVTANTGCPKTGEAALLKGFASLKRAPHLDLYKQRDGFTISGRKNRKEKQENNKPKPDREYLL